MNQPPTFSALNDILYRAVLRLYPRQFRMEYGDEMLLVFRERYRALRAEGGRRFRFFLFAALRDVVIHGLAERWRWLRTKFTFSRSTAGRYRRRGYGNHQGNRSVMNLLQEIKQAVRNLRKRPGFATVVLLTMAVGIGGNVAIFSVVNAVLLEDLPFEAADEIVTLDSRANSGFLVSTSVPNFIDWRERNRSFSTMGAATGWSMTRTGGALAHVVDVRLVFGEFFETLGVDAHIGRVITARETQLGAVPIGVLGHRYWQREFGGDENVIGQNVVLDGDPVEIIGVMPASFGYPASGTEVYVPMGMLPTLPWQNRDSGFGMRPIARMLPGVTLDVAMEDLTRIGRDVRNEFGATFALPEARLLSDYYLGQAGPQLSILMGAVVFVLLIATANVGNLLLVRGEDRRSEIAVRTALGASRADVMRHLVVEGLVFSFLGGVAGVGVAWLLIPVLTAIMPNDAPVALVERIRLDGAVLAFTTLIVVVCGVVFGMLPALRVSRQSPATELRVVQRVTDARGKKLRASLVVVEVALATILLVGAGLMLQSMNRLNEADKGFSEDGLLTGLVRQQFADSATWRSYYTELQSEARALPGVRSVATSLLLPLSNRSWERRIWPEGVPTDRETGQSVLFGVVSQDYFQTLGIPMLAGRKFTAEDHGGTTPVAVIDETMAERYWPGEDPIGKRVTFELDRTAPSDDPVRLYRTVVGVAKNVRHYELVSPSRIQVYIPFTQMAGRWGIDMYVILRTDVPPETLASSFQAVASRIDSDTPIADLQTMSTYVDGRMSGRRAVSGLLVAFGAMALVLAAIGVFGVISYSVSRNTREIGVRLALGAQARDIILWVAGSGLWIGLIGVSVGLAGAAALSRVLSGMLYEVNPVQLRVYGSLGLLLVALCVVAAYLPALGATRIDPVTALRRE